jgi:hypothetical protein
MMAHEPRFHLDADAMGHATLDMSKSFRTRVVYESPPLADVELSQDADGAYFLIPKIGPDANIFPPRGKMDDCLQMFLGLRNQSSAPERVRLFAQTYGFLGFCEHRREVQTGIDPPWMLKSECGECQNLPNESYKEPVAAWVAMASQFHAIRGLTASLRSRGISSRHRRPFRPELLRALVWFPERQTYVGSPTDADPFVIELDPWDVHDLILEALNFWRSPERTLGSYRVRSKQTVPGYFEIAWVVKRLRDHLVARLAAAISGETGFYECENCLTVFERDRKPRRSLCDPCYASDRRQRNAKHMQQKRTLKLTGH